MDEPLVVQLSGKRGGGGQQLVAVVGVVPPCLFEGNFAGDFLHQEVHSGSERQPCRAPAGHDTWTREAVVVEPVDDAQLVTSTSDVPLEQL